MSAGFECHDVYLVAMMKENERRHIPKVSMVIEVEAVDCTS